MVQPRIVIVEDDSDLLEALVREFRDKHFDVFSGRNGREGVSRVLQVRPDVILLDLLMPEKNGHEMMEELLEHHEWVRKTPLVILTNYGRGDEKLGTWPPGMSVSYMIKSETDLEAIVGAVKNLLLPRQES